MKKQLFSVLAASALTLSLASCGDSDTTTEKKDSTTTTMSTNTPAGDTMGSGTTTPQAEQGVMVGGAMMVPSKNIVENAANSQDHTTLVAAVKAADLAGTLAGAGPFTVFAPTNAAFDAVGKDKVEGLLKPENKGKLTSVLTYHVVPGKLMAQDLKDGQKLKTVQGEELTVHIKDGKVMVGDAEVTTPDVVSSNGVTHVINKVLMPKKM